MKYLKRFNELVATQPLIQEPVVKPEIKPRPAKPGKITRPSIDPAPKAEAEDVANRFIELMDKNKEDIKKYL
jgi:hypothetical protein